MDEFAKKKQEESGIGMLLLDNCYKLSLPGVINTFLAVSGFYFML